MNINKDSLRLVLSAAREKSGLFPPHLASIKRKEIDAALSAEDRLFDLFQQRRRLGDRINQVRNEISNQALAITNAHAELSALRERLLTESSAAASIAADARLGTAQVGTAQAIATKKARNEASPEALEAELSELKRRQGERERQLSGLVKEYDDTCRKAYEARADMAHARVLYYSAHLEDALSELAAVYRMAGERGRLICDTTEPDEDAFGRYMETLSVQLADLRIKP